jgi:large subunit ribosomal protein L15
MRVGLKPSRGNWEPALSEEHMATNLSNLRAPKKANTNRKRVGRGMGSGMGKTSTRGHKGQGSRSGSSLMRGFEGGQMPLHRRLPKRGFTNIFRTEYNVLNLDSLANLQETELTLEKLAELGLTKKKGLLKILGNGEITTAITVHAHKFSKSAQEKIERAGGKAVVLGGAPVQG